MPFPFLAAGAALGAANAIGRFFTGNKQKKLANKINPVFNQYQASPFASQQLALAQQLYNGRMVGAANLERNIYSSGANFMGNVNRNATDGSQALALAAAGLGQQNQSLADLQTQEVQNKYAMLGNLNQAYAANIGEGDKVYNSMFQKYQMDVQQKNALMNAAMQNRYGAVSDLAGLGIQLAQMQQQQKNGSAYSNYKSPI